MQGHLHSWQGPQKRLAMALLGTLGAIAFWIGGVWAAGGLSQQAGQDHRRHAGRSFTDLSARLIGDGLRAGVEGIVRHREPAGRCDQHRDAERRPVAARTATRCCCRPIRTR